MFKFRRIRKVRNFRTLRSPLGAADSLSPCHLDQELVSLPLQLSLLHGSEPSEAQPEDGIRLRLGEPERLRHQARSCIGCILAKTEGDTRTDTSARRCC